MKHTHYAEFEKSGNPALNYGGFEVSEKTRTGTMSFAGVSVATFILLAILGTTFAYTWNHTTAGLAESFQSAADATGKLPDSVSIPANVVPYVLVGCLGGFVLALIIIFNPPTAPYLSPVYAAAEGVALGAISAGAESQYPGIASQAIGITFATFAGMLLLHTVGILRATPGLFKFVLACMFGILGLYFADFVLRLFGSYIPIVHGNSTGAIVLQLFIVGIAALNLTLDFGTIDEQLQEGNQPEYMNWYAGFSLMVTLVWLYLEILRLLMKMKSKD